MHRRWIVNKTNAEYVSYLAKAASLSPVVSQVLISRGIRTAADVRDFLNPGMTSLSDPYDLPGISPAVQRIKAARKNGETVLIHGDYDADGLTATAIMVSALRKAGIETGYFIPHRMLHGYGFSIAGVDEARKIGARLIITVDCGVGAFETAEYAQRLGIDVIITDHHEPVTKEGAKGKGQGADDPDGEEKPICGHPLPLSGFVLPHAAAVINPKLNDHTAALHILSGAGIAFKIAHAMALDRDLRFAGEDLLPLLDLAAIGTIADVVPLIGENRVIVREAMPYLQSGDRPGIKALKQAAGLNGRTLKAGLLAFTLIPRINAAGRIAAAGDAVRLFLSGADEEAADLAAWLDRVNRERQQIEEVVYQDALAMLGEQPPDSAVVLAKEGWHAGVLGIVAAKVADCFNLPAFIFLVEEGIAKGSCRSVAAFDICKGLAECSEMLIAYGGHKQAAGVKLRAEDLPEFGTKIQQIIRRDVPEDERAPVLEIHAPVRLNEVSMELIREIERLEPFGYGNPEPVLGSKELDIVSPRIVGNNHLKLKLRKGASVHDAIGFDMGREMDGLSHSALVDAAFTPAYNDWNGTRYLQLVLKGLRPSA